MEERGPECYARANALQRSHGWLGEEPVRAVADSFPHWRDSLYALRQRFSYAPTDTNVLRSLYEATGNELIKRMIRQQSGLRALN